MEKNPKQDQGKTVSDDRGRQRTLNPHPFSQMPSWVYKYRVWADLSGREKAVYGTLCYKADNRTKKCMSKQSDLADCSGVGAHSISSITRALEGKGVIKKKRRGYRMEYEILFELQDSAIERESASMHAVPRNSDILRRSQSGQFVPRKPQGNLRNSSGVEHGGFSETA